MKEKYIKGSCLCGEVNYQYHGDVNYQYHGDVKVFQYCHCSRCQKFTGSAHAANIIIDPEHFSWVSGEEFVDRFEVAEAKHFATCFCRKCGSSLPWKSQSGQAVIIPAGTLDDDPDVKPTHNIFYADKAPWYSHVNTLKKYDKLPIKS